VRKKEALLDKRREEKRWQARVDVESPKLPFSRSRSLTLTLPPFTADGGSLGTVIKFSRKLRSSMGLRGERRVLVGSLVLASARFTRAASTDALYSAGQDRPGQARPRLGVRVGRKAALIFKCPKSELDLHLDWRGQKLIVRNTLDIRGEWTLNYHIRFGLERAETD
jgi:hypothetical protein